MGQRVIALGLDGFEAALARTWVREGVMPNYAKLAADSARFGLESTTPEISWEHIASGRGPEITGARFATDFDPKTYACWQSPGHSVPFAAVLPTRTVVFDFPFFDLKTAPNARGATHWSNHDGSLTPTSNPPELLQEIADRFGPYPAKDWIYELTWPSVKRTMSFGEHLSRAIDERSKVMCWLLGERLPDWDLALVAATELHFSTEALWHGVDPDHPLHAAPSAQPSYDALKSVHVAFDRLIGDLRWRFPDVQLVLFSMHGMTRNQSDVMPMIAIPELMYRHAFGVPNMQTRDWPQMLPDGAPMLAEDERWEGMLASLTPKPQPKPTAMDRLRVLAGVQPPSRKPPVEGADMMTWMPATRYAACWPYMPAFAFPGFFDSPIRLNVKGRESRGIVARAAYLKTRDEIARVLHECRNVLNNAPIVEDLVLSANNPDDVLPGQGDIHVIFKGDPIGLTHPRYGQIGPVPWRRPGGHTFKDGFMWISGAGIAPGERGETHPSNIAPTLIDLAGAQQPASVIGRSAGALLRRPAHEPA